MKPIRSNNEMVKAFLDGRKTCNRKCVKYKGADGRLHPAPTSAQYIGEHCGRHVWEDANNTYSIKPPYQVGDILYVQETFFKFKDKYYYKADIKYEKLDSFFKRCPSIHMPKDAARIFLRVTDVKVERLQDISPIGIRMEGIQSQSIDEWDCEASPESMNLFEFQQVWNSTVKKKDILHYGWNANPWVWVIEFEQISREDTELED